MSIKTMALVWESDIPGTEKLVLLALADWANDDGVCWPHQETIGKRCSCTTRNVRKVLTSLEARGLLTRKHRGRAGVVYHLNIDEIKNRNCGSTFSEENRNCGSAFEKENRNCGSARPELEFRSIEPSLNRKERSPSKSSTAASLNVPSDHSWFTAWWCHSFEAVTASRYAYSKKSAGIIKRLLDSLGLEELVGRACAYLTMPGARRFPQGAPTLEGLAAMVNQLAGRCDAETEETCSRLGILPDDFETPLLAFRPWETAA